MKLPEFDAKATSELFEQMRREEGLGDETFISDGYHAHDVIVDLARRQHASDQAIFESTQRLNDYEMEALSSLANEANDRLEKKNSELRKLIEMQRDALDYQHQGMVILKRVFDGLEQGIQTVPNSFPHEHMKNWLPKIEKVVSALPKSEIE